MKSWKLCKHVYIHLRYCNRHSTIRMSVQLTWWDIGPARPCVWSVRLRSSCPALGRDNKRRRPSTSRPSRRERRKPSTHSKITVTWEVRGFMLLFHALTHTPTVALHDYHRTPIIAGFYLFHFTHSLLDLSFPNRTLFTHSYNHLLDTPPPRPRISGHHDKH